MWNRRDLKDRAKAELRTSYWTAVLVSLVGLLLGASGVGTAAFSGSGSSRTTRETIGNINYTIAFIALAIAGFAFLLFVAYSIFVGNVISVGLNRFYLQCPKGDRQFSYLFSAFNKNEYWQVVRTMFIQGFYIFIWTLLFIIPGIIKSYEYKFVPYIVAENPQIDHNQALNMSRDLTSGHKWDMFVLDLSFILWHIAASVVVIGHIFLNPYKEATHVQLYYARCNALYSNPNAY